MSDSGWLRKNWDKYDRNGNLKKKRSKGRNKSSFGGKKTRGGSENAKWWAKYTEYLKSPQWKSKRQELFNERGKRCESCGRTENIQVHHLTYRNVFNENLEDLQVLCKKCHSKKH